MCRVVSYAVGKGCLLWEVHSLGKTLLAFALLHFVLQGQTCLLPQISLDFLLLHSNSLWWKGHLFLVLVLEILIGLIEPFTFSFLGINGWGIDLDDCNIEWLALEMNQDHSVIFGVAPKYCILDSFVDYEGHSISSMGFLSIVVDIMIIWIKFTLPLHFSSLILRCQFLLLPFPVWLCPIYWLVDLTFQVPMQYCSLQHWILLSPSDTSTTEHRFRFDPASSFSLELFCNMKEPRADVGYNMTEPWKQAY